MPIVEPKTSAPDNAQVVRWSRVRRLKHPDLPSGSLMVEWLSGRWVPIVFNCSNGLQLDGLETLSASGLSIAERFHPVPRLERV